MKISRGIVRLWGALRWVSGLSSVVFHCVSKIRAHGLGDFDARISISSLARYPEETIFVLDFVRAY